MYKIYALIHPKTNEVRYIGYTKGSLTKRLRYHYYDISRGVKSHKVSWLKALGKQELTAEIIELEGGIADLQTALDRERHWISQYSNLVNSTSGGESNKVYRADVVAKMSQNRKGKMVGEDNPMYGKIREDLRQRNIENNPAKNKETAARIGAKLKELYSTDQYRQIHRDNQTTRKAVVQMDMEGNRIKEYQSIREARTEGYGGKEIKMCCDGKYRQHKGFKWQYA